MPVIKSHLDIPDFITFYNYLLIYSFIEQMFIEYPPSMLISYWFGVTGKEATYMTGRGKRFKRELQDSEEKGALL